MPDTPDHHNIETPAETPPSPSTAEAAGGLVVRAVARLIDFVPIAVVNAVVAVILGDYLGALVGAVVGLTYFAGMESSGGQTVGKMVMKLRTVGPTGQVPTIDQALRRNIWVAFGIAGVVPFVGGLIGSAAQLVAVIVIGVGLADEKGGRRGWHDRFAGGTLVVPASSDR